MTGLVVDARGCPAPLRSTLAVAALSIALGCGRPIAMGGNQADLPRYAYAISPPAAGAWRMTVEAIFEHATTARLVAPEGEAAVTDLVLVDGAEARPVAFENGAWVAAPCRSRCDVRYAVDLDRWADECHGWGCPRRVGDAILGPSSAWLVRPEIGDASIQVRVRGGDPTRFATGLRRDAAGGFILRAKELVEASYSAFGSFRRSRIEVVGSPIEVAELGAPLAMGDATALRWIGDAAGCVARLFGRFPASATVFVVPVAGADRVVFGRVMSLAGASVLLLFGSETRVESEHEDWVVVHELFHLGTPSFVGEGHWLEEGLATYYEPILRARAGWTSENDLWAHFAREMPRGLRKAGDPENIEERQDIDSTYWGGALFALLADVEIRRATKNARSLDDVLRVLLDREGDATHVARVADFVRIGDQTAGAAVLSRLYERVALRGASPDLDAVWRSLGVTPVAGGAVVLDEPSSPLAAVRHAISAGDGH